MIGFINDIRGLSIGVRRFIISEALLGISIGIFSLVLNLHLLSKGINEAEIGKITSMGTLIMGIVSIPFGLMANRFGRKRILVLGLALMGIGYLLFALGNQPITFYMAQAIQSIGLTMLIITEIQLLFHYCSSKQEETQSYSLLFAIFTLFVGVGTILGGYLPRWIEIGDSKYQGSLLVATAVMFLISVVRGLWFPKEQPTGSITDHTNIKGKNRKRWLPSRGIWVFSTFALLMGITFAFIGPFLNVIVKFRFGWTDEWVSILLTINGLFLFFASLMMPYLFNRFGIAKAFYRIFIINIVLTFALFFTMPAALFAIILLWRGGFFMLLSNMVDSQSMSAIAEDERNLFAGIRSVLRSIGSAIATYMAGIILVAKNYSLPFLLASASILLTLVFFLLVVRPLLDEQLKGTKTIK